MEDEDFQLEPSLQNIVDNNIGISVAKDLRWVFVGGKGGVGKSTTSSSLAVSLAKHRKSVLLISLDPAHNLSDAFSQQFSGKETLVQGFENLFAMELDPKELSQTDYSQELLGGADSGVLAGFGDIFSTIPGINEAMALFQLMKQIETSKHDIVIFDTAPTGHTLSLLGSTRTLQKLFDKFSGIKDKFGGLLTSVTSLMGGSGSSGDDDDDSDAATGIFDKMEDLQQKVIQIEQKLQDPNYTTFVCVAIPEFLSLFETERLVQELTTLHIDVQNIVVNQVLFPDECSDCKRCQARIKMQQKYIDQAELLYIDFHLIKMPLLDQEIRGVKFLTIFGQMLITGKPNPFALTSDQ